MMFVLSNGIFTGNWYGRGKDVAQKTNNPDAKVMAITFSTAVGNVDVDELQELLFC